MYFNSRLHKVHQPVQTQMVVTPLPELLSKSSLLQGGRKEDSSWFVLRNHLLALSFKDSVNACLLLRSTILLVCCSTMHHVGVDSDDNGLNLLSTTQCLSASVCKVIGAPAAHRQSLPFLYDVNSSGKEGRKLKSRTRPTHAWHGISSIFKARLIRSSQAMTIEQRSSKRQCLRLVM